MALNCMRKAAVLTAILALGLLLLGGCRPDSAASPSPTPEQPGAGAVLTVDGYGVPVEEFQLFLLDERALTAAYFGQKYGAEIDAGFWDREFDGQTPNQYAREAALQELVRAKTEAILLKERGLVDDISYEALMADMERTNAERAEKLKTGEIFYGLTQYDSATYYAYVRAQRWGKLTRSQMTFYTPTLEELRTFYNDNPGYFTTLPSYLCQFVYADGFSEERVVSSEIVHKEDAAGATLLSMLEELSPGDTLTGMSMDGRAADVTLLSVTPGTLLSFGDESIQAQLTALCQESALYDLIAARAANAKVEIDQALYVQQILG